jgi:hypothetical protein
MVAKGIIIFHFKAYKKYNKNWGLGTKINHLATLHKVPFPFRNENNYFLKMSFFDSVDANKSVKLQPHLKKSLQKQSGFEI